MNLLQELDSMEFGDRDQLLKEFWMDLTTDYDESMESDRLPYISKEKIKADMESFINFNKLSLKNKKILFCLLWEWKNDELLDEDTIQDIDPILERF